MSFQLTVIQGASQQGVPVQFHRTFDRFLGGKCGSKYCQCRREDGGVEDTTRKIRKKPSEDAPQKSKRPR